MKHPITYAKRLKRLLDENPKDSLEKMSKETNVSITWLASMLRLLNLTEGIQVLVESGTICLSNAFALSKLAEEEQIRLKDRASTEAASRFITYLER